MRQDTATALYNAILGDWSAYQPTHTDRALYARCQSAVNTERYTQSVYTTHIHQSAKHRADRRSRSSVALCAGWLCVGQEPESVRAGCGAGAVVLRIGALCGVWGWLVWAPAGLRAVWCMCVVYVGTEHQHQPGAQSERHSVRAGSGAVCSVGTESTAHSTHSVGHTTPARRGRAQHAERVRCAVCGVHSGVYLWCMYTQAHTRERHTARTSQEPESRAAKRNALAR